MGGDADRGTVHHGAELCHDHERVRAVIPSVSVHGGRAPDYVYSL